MNFPTDHPLNLGTKRQSMCELGCAFFYRYRRALGAAEPEYFTRSGVKIIHLERDPYVYCDSRMGFPGGYARDGMFGSIAAGI